MAQQTTRTQRTVPATAAGQRRIQTVALVVAAAGIVVQLAAGADYPPVPPGLVMIVLAAVVGAFVARRWPVAVGVVVAVFLILGGMVADPGWRDLLDAPGRAVQVGAAVQLAGLLVAAAAGVLVLVRGRHGVRSR